VNDPVIELVEASLRYVRGPIWRRNSIWAVRGVSLAIHARETVGLVGESGSGKTSIGRLALGMVSPARGVVRFQSQPLTGSAKRRRGKLQVVLQHPEWSLNPRLRCGTSVAEPLAILAEGSPAARRVAVTEMLELVGLDAGIARRFPHELSGWQRQRVAIARALITSPRFIVFDEVVSALDVSIQAQILNLIKRLQSERGFAALFISHELAAVRYVSNRVAVMYAGEIVEAADSIEFYSAASHPYTRALQAAARGDTTYQLRDAFQIPDVGCPLEPRCPMAIGICREVHPPLRPLAGRMVACHRAEEVTAGPVPPPVPLEPVANAS
jgi:ABC-type glutathione transport system ATPase component